MKFRGVRKAAGKTVTRVHRGGETFKVKAAVPKSEKLFNFNVKSKAVDLLILDPYGTLDDGMSLKMYRRIFGRGKEQTIGVDRKTGELLTVAFALDDDGMLAFFVGPIGMYGASVPDMWLPLEWVSRIDELLSKKRPFRLAVDEITLLDFIARDVGYHEFAKNLVVRFDFDDTMLEVSGTSYRTVSRWRDPSTVLDVLDPSE